LAEPSNRIAISFPLLAISTDARRLFLPICLPARHPVLRHDNAGATA
jgi:hypothetical protein